MLGAAVCSRAGIASSRLQFVTFVLLQAVIITGKEFVLFGGIFSVMDTQKGVLIVDTLLYLTETTILVP